MSAFVRACVIVAAGTAATLPAMAAELPAFPALPPAAAEFPPSEAAALPMLDEPVGNADAVAPQPADPVKDPFREALTHVYASNPVIKAQREALKAIDESVAQAISGFRPSVEAGYDTGRQRTATGGADWTYQDATTKSLSVTQPIFSGGESWSGFKSARERVRAGRAMLKSVEQQVLYNAVVAFTDVVEKQLVLKENQNNVDVLTSQRDATQQRFDVGELTRTDTAQSQARLANAQASERQALGNLETARATFKRTIGYDPPEELSLPVIPPGLPQSAQEAVTWAEASNPDLTAAQYSQSAASTDIDVRAAALLPDVSIQGTMDRSERASVNPSVRKFDNDALTLNVSIPLYQSGAEWSRVREAKNQAQQAKFATLDTRHAVVESATRAWQDYNTAKAIITSTEEAMKAAEVALEGVRQENEIGVRSILDVLDAEQEFFTSRVNLVTAQRAEKVLAYQLLATVGLLTPQNLQLPVEVYDPKEHYDDVKYQLIGF